MLTYNPTITGSLILSGSFNVCGQSNNTFPSASYAITASYAENAGSGGGGSDFSSGLISTGSTIISGSLIVSGSTDFQFLSSSESSTTYGAGVWSTVSSVPQGKISGGGSGTTNGALYFGGTDDPTYSYNGSAWSQEANQNHASTGTGGTGASENAALKFGGTFPSPSIPTYNNCTETYNGTSWSAAGALTNCSFYTQGYGTVNAGSQTGGYAPPSYGTNQFHSQYDGSSWSSATNLPANRSQAGSAGTQNAGLVIKGLTSPGCFSNNVEWNGSAWSTGGTTPSGAARYNAAAGTQNDAVQWHNLCTDCYNGTSWSSANNMILSKQGGTNNVGVSTAALSIGSYQQSTATSATNVQAFLSPATPGTTTITTGSYLSTTDSGFITLSRISSSYDYADDTEAASAGIPLGGLYRSGSFVKIRLS
jgi:hypothetical protein